MKTKAGKKAASSLKKHGIKTMADLDKWALKNPRTDKWGRPFIMGRYKCLVELVGENAAIEILNNLAIEICC